MQVYRDWVCFLFFFVFSFCCLNVWVMHFCCLFFFCPFMFEMHFVFTFISVQWFNCLCFVFFSCSTVPVIRSIMKLDFVVCCVMNLLVLPLFFSICVVFYYSFFFVLLVIGCLFSCIFMILYFENKRQRLNIYKNKNQNAHRNHMPSNNWVL